MKIALYARVSTADKGQDPEMQLRELREYVERRGFVLAGEYVDAGISGAKDSRPELNRLMADAHKRRFDAVCVWKFDRFARSVSHLLRALETFKALGIEFVSFSEQMDTSTPGRKDGLYRPRCRCRTGAQPDRGACEGGAAECAGEGEADRTAACSRGCREDCRSASTTPFLATDRKATWRRSWHGVPRLSGAFQNPQGGKPFENPCFRDRARR